MTPRRSIHGAALLSALALGCGGAPEPLPKVASAEPSASEAPARAASWKIHRSPLEGVTVAMPGEPHESYSSFPLDDDVKAYTHTLKYARTGGNFPTYVVERLRFPGTPQVPIDEALTGFAKVIFGDITDARPITVQGYRGRAFEGSTREEKKRLVARLFIAGRNVYILSVTSPSAEAVGEQDVAPFFDSFRLEEPWELYTSEAGRYVIAVPSIAAQSDVELKGGGDPMRLFYMGGEAELTYAAAHFNVDPERLKQSGADELLDAMITGFGSIQGSSIEKLKGVEQDGHQGRDATLLHGDGKHARVRAFLASDRIYLLQVVATTKPPLNDAGAQRFFESFRVGRAP